MNTRKKVIKTVFKDDNDSEEETGDFSDSGSEAKITEQSSSEDEEDEHIASSGDEFKNVHKNVKNMPLRSKQANKQVSRKPKFAKSFVNKICKQVSIEDEGENSGLVPSYISVKDLTEADKLLPSVLNLSESDSSDDDSPKTLDKRSSAISNISHNQDDDDSENETKTEFRDVWSHNIHDSELSKEIARKAFLELEQHKSELEQTKATLTNYTTKVRPENEFDVSDLLAQGEDLILQKKTVAKRNRGKKPKDDSDSEMEDWEEVQESKPIPKQGIQLIVEVPDLVCRKTKTIDVEMMMKRKLNRVKKEYQIYMHKVHVLCWLGHGNYVSQVLNEQEILAATLSLVPGKECYPGERVDLKYIEQITTWYKDKLTFKLDKNENKFRPKAPPLKEILLAQIKSRGVTAKKYLVFIFVAMLRALGLQCRIMFNFVTLPIKPPTSELCSLSTKATDKKDVKQKSKNIKGKQPTEIKTTAKVSDPKSKIKEEISQVDGTDDSMYIENIMQLDGNNDILPAQTRSTRARKAKSSNVVTAEADVSPPKRSKKANSSKPNKSTSETETRNAQGPKPSTEKELKKNTNPPQEMNTITKTKRSVRNKKNILQEKKPPHINTSKLKEENLETTEKTNIKKTASPRKTRGGNKDPAHINKSSKSDLQQKTSNKKANLVAPKIVITKTDESLKVHSSKYFDNEGNSDGDETRVSRKRSKTVNPPNTQTSKDKDKQEPIKGRTKSALGSAEKSKYFAPEESASSPTKKIRLSLKSNKAESKAEDQQRVSHRDLAKSRAKPKNDVTADLVNIIKGRVKEAKEESQKGIVKGKIKQKSDEDSDFLPEEDIKEKSESDDDFKPSIISPRPGTSKQVRKKIDRRIISTDDDTLTSTVKVDVWCEVFVEELEQWISVNVIKGKVHCAENIYSGASHPVCYVVGWDNNNYLKDLTRRYVPHWNTVTRKQRAEPAWWGAAVRPWLGPRNARDREEDEQLDRMQLDAPLPKSIGEYKNHPLYALKRHLLKFEAIYPPDAATLGFVRGEAVYARECVYTCQSRDKWLKDAKVVRLGEKPFKVVKARPKWDKLSNKLITDKPLEVFGPWQVQDYEPPTAEGGIVPRNAYGNVELFKPCMLPKGTVHIKLPGLNRVAKKLNIDCASAMTGFDFNGGWSHPVYDGFVVCKEFEEIITEAWVEDQELLERKEQEKTEARVYGNWRRLIKGLLIRERLKKKYGFEEPSTSQDKKKSKGPRLVVTKRKS